MNSGKVESIELSPHRIDEKFNPADLVTKHLGREDVHRHVRAIMLGIRAGKSKAAIELHNLDAQRDRWEVEEDRIARHHGTPRRALFMPPNTTNGKAFPMINSRRCTKGITMSW